MRRNKKKITDEDFYSESHVTNSSDKTKFDIQKLRIEYKFKNENQKLSNKNQREIVETSNFQPVETIFHSESEK